MLAGRDVVVVVTGVFECSRSRCENVDVSTFAIIRNADVMTCEEFRLRRGDLARITEGRGN